MTFKLWSKPDICQVDIKCNVLLLQVFLSAFYMSCKPSYVMFMGSDNHWVTQYEHDTIYHILNFFVTTFKGTDLFPHLFLKSRRK